MQFLNSLSNIKTELKVFFVIWLCLFFIFSPLALGLQLTPRVLAPQAHAIFGLLGGIVKAANWVWEALTWAYDKVQIWAVETWRYVKDILGEYLSKALSMALQMALMMIIQKLTNSIIKWIQGGFHGQPGFVTDWQSYLKQAGQSAAGRFLNDLAGVNLCGSFKLQLRVALSLPYPDFKTQAACTLDKILANVNSTIADFQNDFRKGGWIAYEESLKPNNSAFGAWLMATDAKNALSFANIQKAEKEATSGFKPTKKCMSTNSKQTKAEQNKGACDEMYRTLGDRNISSEQRTAIQTNYDNLCTGNATTSTIDASTVDPNSPDCSSSMTTAPDGTVEFNTNLASNSTMKQLQEGMTNLTASAGSYAPFIMAIANALINQLVKDGTSGLMGMVAQKEKPSPEDLATPIPGTEMIIAFKEISNDVAATDRTKGALDQISSSGLIQNAIITFQELLTITQSIQNKQNSIINDDWTSGVWDNKINDSNGTETVDDDAIATIIESQINSSSIENCVDTQTTTQDAQGNTIIGITTNCVATSATTPPYSTSTLTNYTRTTTITTTTYNISHPRVGKISLTEVKTETVDGRTTMVTNTTNQNYDTTPATFSFSLIPPTQNQIEDIDGKVSEYQNKASGLSKLHDLMPTVKASLINFEKFANIFIKEFQNDATSNATQSAYDKIKSARDAVISALQTITGSDKKTMADLTQDLEYLIGNAGGVDMAKNSLVTVTESDGTQSAQSPKDYYQTYLNDVIAIYNSLLSAKNSGYLSPIGGIPTTTTP